MADTTTTAGGADAPFPLPRVTIKFCTQCKWNLRAAYFAQELLSTFSTTLGEVALQPSTGGTFVVEIFHAVGPASLAAATPLPSHPGVAATVLWDRATDGGFPETKVLKRRVRDVIEPGRHLGHVDRDHPTPAAAESPAAQAETTPAAGEKPLPTKAELEAVGSAGGGYPGASEAAAVLVGDLQQQQQQQGTKKKSEGREGEKACEDCS